MEITVGSSSGEKPTVRRTLTVATRFVDKEGVIRAIDREVKPATHGQDLVKLVKEWLQGK